MNVKRFNQLLDISNITFLTFDEQEEFIALSTEMMYHMLETEKIVDDILNTHIGSKNTKL